MSTNKGPMADRKKIKSVAVIGAGASGAAAAAALSAEKYFDVIRVFERREIAGGTWIHDANPTPQLKIHPGALPADIDPPLQIPDSLPRVTSPVSQERYEKTPVYDNLTTNVPDIAMSFSDTPFAYGPFVPHHIPRQYIENYFSLHKTDSLLVLNTTVELCSKIKDDMWILTLRRHDAIRNVDEWWKEEFDAVILANGHYSIPYVPEVKGLKEYTEQFPGKVVHSKYYRSPQLYHNKKVLIIGNSASGKDVSAELVTSVTLPVYQSRRSASRWDGDQPPPGISWKPVVREYLPTGRIIFDDDSYLDDIDTVIYATGYKASFPFWDTKSNGAPIWNHHENRLEGSYLHTFLKDFRTLGIIGVPRVLTFRSFEYQAIALARIFANRNAVQLPSKAEQTKWQRERSELTKREKRKFHDIVWENGETLQWLGELFEIAGLGTLDGKGRIPPVLGEKTRWAIENVKKYPEPKRDEFVCGSDNDEDGERDWVLLDRNEGRPVKDLLHFI